MTFGVTKTAGTITTTDVTSGWIATLYDGEGNAVEYWAATEAEAREKAENAREADT